MAAQALIDSLLEPFAGEILKAAINFFSEYWDKVGLYVTVGLAVCLPLAAVLLLNLQQILRQAILYKFYVPIIIFAVVLLFRLPVTWNTTSSTQKDVPVVEVWADPQEHIKMTEEPNTQPEDLVNPQQESKQSSSESDHILHVARSDGRESSQIKFDNNCETYSSKLLLF